MPEKKPNLVMKLAEVMLAVSHVEKRGRNDFHKYDYATDADILAAVRKELAERNVVLLPGCDAEHRESVGSKGEVVTSLSMTMTFLDGDSGETLERPWRGWGTDKLDKGGYKAMTGGEKYFILKSFLLPTGDDPEAKEGDHGEAATDHDKPAQQAQAKPVSNLPTGASRVVKVTAGKGKGPGRVEIVNAEGVSRTFKAWPEMLAAAQKYCAAEVDVFTVAAQREPERLKDDGTPWPESYMLTVLSHMKPKPKPKQMTSVSELAREAESTLGSPVLDDGEQPPPPELDLSDVPF